jgi:hypothetical protein
VVAVNRLRAAATALARFLGIVVVVGVTLYASMRVTVRMPLAVPLALAALVLVLLAALCRRTPRDVFSGRTSVARKPVPAAIEASATPAWAFDEEEL